MTLQRVHMHKHIPKNILCKHLSGSNFLGMLKFLEAAFMVQVLHAVSAFFKAGIKNRMYYIIFTRMLAGVCK